MNPWLTIPHPAGSKEYATANYEFFKAEGEAVTLENEDGWWFVAWNEDK